MYHFLLHITLFAFSLLFIFVLLFAKVRDAKKETDEALLRMRKTEVELQQTKQRYHEQEEQLLRKSGESKNL